ncbi:uncharacterized protein LOC143183262 [Calliopsis andreniformis]|uniref:uncharacterized protein LOC143183262 n=1 Tax=Calliopsis andreniformis TaxID=337506 RepID=UPI003FCE5E6C
MTTMMQRRTPQEYRKCSWCEKDKKVYPFQWRFSTTPGYALYVRAQSNTSSLSFHSHQTCNIKTRRYVDVREIIFLFEFEIAAKNARMNLRANAKGDLAKLDCSSHDALNTTLRTAANETNAKSKQPSNSNVTQYFAALGYFLKFQSLFTKI